MKAAPHRRESDIRYAFWRATHNVAQTFGSGLWNFIDNRSVVRRIAFFWVLWMTTVVIWWAMDFADDHPDMDGLKMAAILGAVLTPWNLMVAAIWKFYSDSADQKVPMGVTTIDTSRSVSRTETPVPPKE